MNVANSARDQRTIEARRPAGVDDRADRPSARVRSHEWHTGSTNAGSTIGPAATAPVWAAGPVSASLELGFTRDRLGELRRFVTQFASEASLDPTRIGDLVLAINELATNSVCHAGGAGTLRMWREADVLLCDIHDQGHILQSSVCAVVPEPTQISGRGLWIVSQLCDLVQIRSSRRGSVVRIQMRLT